MIKKSILLLVFIMTIIALPGCANSDEDVVRFDFILKFGVSAKNEISTYDGTFKKDLNPGQANTKLLFTDKEIEHIYNKMMEIDILKYPTKFNPLGENLNTGASDTYYFKVRINDVEKEIEWYDEFSSKEPKAVALRNLIKDIENLIYKKPEYKKLPPAKGSYKR